MRHAVLRLALTVVLAAPAACGGRSTRSSGYDADLITREQIEESRFTNAYQVVEALRSNWLRGRGTDSLEEPTQVQVYFNNTRLGGVETLRSLSTRSIAFIRHYDGVEAAGRWGLDHGQGVIQVSTRY